MVCPTKVNSIGVSPRSQERVRRSAILLLSRYLHQIGFLVDILPEFYARTIIPPAVAAELERGRSMDIDLPNVRALSWIAIQSPEGLDKVPTAPDLDAGETEVLALAMQVPGALVIMDGRIGRRWVSYCGPKRKGEFRGSSRCSNI